MNMNSELAALMMKVQASGLLPEQTAMDRLHGIRNLRKMLLTMVKPAPYGADGVSLKLETIMLAVAHELLCCSVYDNENIHESINWIGPFTGRLTTDQIAGHIIRVLRATIARSSN